MEEYKIHKLWLPLCKTEMHRQKDKNKTKPKCKLNFIWGSDNRLTLPPFSHFIDCIQYFFNLKYCEMDINIKKYYC